MARTKSTEMKFFSAVVKDKHTGKTVFVERTEYTTKQAFIVDLKHNGYTVNPYKVKPSDVFEYILNHTNCTPWDWKNITEVGQPRYEEWLRQQQAQAEQQATEQVVSGINQHAQKMVNEHNEACLDELEKIQLNPITANEFNNLLKNFGIRHYSHANQEQMFYWIYDKINDDLVYHIQHDTGELADCIVDGLYKYKEFYYNEYWTANDTQQIHINLSAPITADILLSLSDLSELKINNYHLIEERNKEIEEIDKFFADLDNNNEETANNTATNQQNNDRLVTTIELTCAWDRTTKWYEHILSTPTQLNLIDRYINESLHYNDQTDGDARIILQEPYDDAKHASLYLRDINDIDIDWREPEMIKLSIANVW